MPPISLTREPGSRDPAEISLPEVEDILGTRGWETDTLIARAQAGIATVVEARIGGNCWTPPVSILPTGSARRPLLVATHDRNDPRLRALGIDGSALDRMYDAIDAERAGRDVFVIAAETESRPAIARIRSLATARGWRMVDQPVDPWSLLEITDRIFTTGDEIGLLGLLKGMTVRCFGRPAYGGWGLTADDPALPARNATRTLAEIFAAACILGTAYRDPYNGRAWTFEDACAALAEWRRIDRENNKIAVCLGMSIWKRQRIRDLLRSHAGLPRFSSGVGGAIGIARRSQGAIAVWASREPPQLAAAAAAANVPVVRVEDGFLRSVGLGANFTPAASMVVDDCGMYFDPRQPSGLDRILGSCDFGAPLLDRARRLIDLLIAGGITKYNVGAAMPSLDLPPDARTIFVPGQVENDRSVALGGGGITRNIDLLRRVRADNPDAIIFYKPHPDVDAGHRPGAIPDPDVLTLADSILRGVSSAAIIGAVDEIHTLTSLAGFEALIRGKRVVVHGRPFYAGWGLTTDSLPIPHRQRILSLEQLVAGTIILYPRYIDPVTRLPCGAELLIERLSQPELWNPGLLVRLRRLQGVVVRRLRDGRSATHQSL